MDNQNKIKMSKKELARIQVVELGKILFNLQIVMAVIVASPLPFAIYPIYYAGLILISVFTGFIIFVSPRFVALWKPTKIYGVLSAILGAWKYTIPIVIALSLLSILCLCFDKKNRHIKRIVTSIVVIVLVLVYLILRLCILKSGGAVG